MIRRVHNVFAARSLGDRAYVRTPSVCPPSGVWAFKVQFTWADGAVTDDVSEMPCMRDRTLPRIRLAGVPLRRCSSRGFRVRVRIEESSALQRVHVRLDGRLLRATTAKVFVIRVRTRRLRTGRHRLTVIARDASGNRTWRTLLFRRC